MRGWDCTEFSNRDIVPLKTRWDSNRTLKTMFDSMIGG